jgi:putative nucleotidyltransferase with HDIG domain
MLPNFEITKRIPAKELSVLLKVSSALSRSLDLSSVLQTAIESAIEVLELQTGAIYLLEDEWVYMGATTPAMGPELRELLLKPESIHDHPHLKQSLLLRKPVYITDAEKADMTPAEAAIRDGRRLRSILFIPLLLEEKATGVIIVGSTNEVREFTDEEIDLCRILSSQVTLAVANAQLFRSVQQSNKELIHAYDATLKGWSLALEMRDQDTQGHTQRVAEMTVELARMMGIPNSQLAHIHRGALLHDIGKMSIPDTILKKTGPLTEDEWALMRKHTEFAYQFVMRIDYLLPALDIPYCHHEKWDGSGYPRGLKGENIPLSARIFTVVDVFDALTSDRPYRKAWEREDALQYIRDQSGKHFDPRVVVVFLRELIER